MSAVPLDRPNIVVMQTEIEHTGVRYKVWHRRTPGDIAWERFVRFGRKAYYRPGGMAFRQAALEQERQAYRVAGLLTDADEREGLRP